MTECAPPCTVKPYYLVRPDLDNERFAVVSDAVSGFYLVFGHDTALRDNDLSRLGLECSALPDKTRLNLCSGLIRRISEGIFTAGNPPLPKDCLMDELIDYSGNRDSPPILGNKKAPPKRGE
jgi:hypothetical protein